VERYSSQSTSLGFEGYPDTRSRSAIDPSGEMERHHSWANITWRGGGPLRERTYC